MIRFGIITISLLYLLTSCWPSRVGFKDQSFPDEWKAFTVKTLDNRAPNTPLSYAPTLSEAIKDGIQNNTSLNLATTADSAQLEIEGTIDNYSITPVAIQDGDQASKNRLSVSVTFQIYIKAPEEDEMIVRSTRFIDYESSTDLSVVESTLLEDVNAQIVQDVINQLFSNW
ncbi:MAG: hypothetical protein ACI837_000891 [Crocinitomicaceae bacterium]|jgi:hypothetical protein